MPREWVVKKRQDWIWLIVLSTAGMAIFVSMILFIVIP